MGQTNEKMSLFQLFSNKDLNFFQVGNGKKLSYAEFVKREIVAFGNERADLQKIKFPTDEQKVWLSELDILVPRLEDEYMKLTRFGKGEFAEALKKVTHRTWKFCHVQKQDKNGKWNLSLQIRQARGNSGCTYATLALAGRIDDVSDLDEVRAKLMTDGTGQGAKKLMFDDAMKYFMTGDPQFSYKVASSFSWKEGKMAFRQHLCSHFVDMELYEMFKNEGKALQKEKVMMPQNSEKTHN